eukprot:5820961-Ditylum_brightwellii.AAC.1
MMVVEEAVFSYIDMQMPWLNLQLYFSVCYKKNQTIKYINRESCHCNAVFKAIPEGIFTNLGQLTSLIGNNATQGSQSWQEKL